MPNPELSQRIRALPEELLGLERVPGIAERLRRIDALKDRARALDPLDGVEDMALADYDRDWLVRYTYNQRGELTHVHDRADQLVREFEWEHHHIRGHHHQGGPWHSYRYASAQPGARVILSDMSNWDSTDRVRID